MSSLTRTILCLVSGSPEVQADYSGLVSALGVADFPCPLRRTAATLWRLMYAKRHSHVVGSGQMPVSPGCSAYYSDVIGVLLEPVATRSHLVCAPGRAENTFSDPNQ